MALFYCLILFFIDGSFIFRLESVIRKKYGNTYGKYSKHTNPIDISITGTCCIGRGRRHRVTCRERGRGCRPFRRGRVSSCFSSSIFSFSLFMYVSCDFLPRSCLLESFVTFSDVLSMFYFKQNGKG